MIKLYAKVNGLHKFPWVYVILANLCYAIFAAKNSFSHFSPTGSIFGKSFSIPFVPFNAGPGLTDTFKRHFSKQRVDPTVGDSLLRSDNRTNVLSLRHNRSHRK